MKAYLYFLKLKLTNSLYYHFEISLDIVAQLIILISVIFLWKTAYKGIDQVDGVTEQEMITYTIVSFLLARVFQTGVTWSISEKIQTGQIAIDLVRPSHLLVQLLAEDIGSSIAACLIYSIPATIFSLAFFQILLPANIVIAFWFIISCIMSFGILWLMSALVAQIAFWAMELGNMADVKDVVVRILSGSIVPIWFFPSWFQLVSKYLPFQYTYQTPLSIYIGRIQSQSMFEAISIQLLWIIILSIALHLLWGEARKRVLVQGG